MCELFDTDILPQAIRVFEQACQKYPRVDKPFIAGLVVKELKIPSLPMEEGKTIPAEEVLILGRLSENIKAVARARKKAHRHYHLALADQAR